MNFTFENTWCFNTIHTPYRDHKDHQDREEKMDSKVLLDQEESLDNRERLVREENLVNQDRTANQGQEVNLDFPALRVNLVTKALRVHVANQDNKGLRDLEEKMDSVENKVLYMSHKE